MTYSDTSSSRSSDSDEEAAPPKKLKAEEKRASGLNQTSTGTDSQKPSNSANANESQGGSAAQKTKASTMDITNRTGGAYIPPAKLRLMQKEITDKSR